MSYANKVAGPAANGRGTVKRVTPPGTGPQNDKPAPGSSVNAKEGTAKSAVPASNPTQGNERLLFGASVLIGYKVEVQVKSGAVYEGIFYTLKINEAEVHVVLKYAKMVKDPSATAESVKDALAERHQETMTVNSDDLVQIVARDVRFNPEDLKSDERNEFGFETDASIGRGRAGAAWGRELQPWAPDENDDSGLLDLGGGENDGGSWDQFAVNREKFGVETTFDELLYTTKIDRENCGITEAEAAKLAREIESGCTSGNVHLMEERGYIDDSGDVDEEDKYSAVVRPVNQQHHHQHHQHQHQHQHQQQQHPQHGYHYGHPHQGGYQPPHDRRPRYAHQPHQHQPAPPVPPAPRAPAWGGLGSGVAAVAGRALSSGLPPPPPPPQRAPPPPTSPPAQDGSNGGAAQAQSAPSTVPAASVPTDAGTQPAVTSSPLDIDPMRREANKVRSQLLADTGAVATKRDRASPYGTPKGLKDSPLIHDPDSMRALHLIPGKTNVPPEVDKDFKAWKQQQQQGQDRKPQLLDDFKKFSSTFNASQLKAGDKADSAAATAAAPTTSAAATVPAPATPAAPAAPAAVNADASSSKGEGTGAAPAAPAADAAPKKSSLNPNAKPFTLNFNAKPFVPVVAVDPGSGASGAGASSAPAAGSAPRSIAPIAVTAAGPAAVPTANSMPGASGSHMHQGAHNLSHQPSATAQHIGSHHSRNGSSGSGIHSRPDRESRGGGGGMERRGQGGRMGGMMGGDGHYPGHGPVHPGGMQGQGGHKMMGMHANQHHGMGEHHPGPEHMHKGPLHLPLNQEHMGGHKNASGPMGIPDHVGHKGAPPPPHHGPGSPMDSPGGLMPGMPTHGMPQHMQTHMGMPPFMQMPYHMGPGGAMVPAGGPMIPGPVFPGHGMRPSMSPNGAPMMVPYGYPMPMQPGGAGPGGRPQFFQGMPVGMPLGAMPMMAGPMPPMDHPPRMGPGGADGSAPTGNSKGMRGPRQDRRDGGFHGEGRHHHNAPPPHRGPHEGVEPQATE